MKNAYIRGLKLDVLSAMIISLEQYRKSKDKNGTLPRAPTCELMGAAYLVLCLMHSHAPYRGTSQDLTAGMDEMYALASQL
jgi:hypothetical protein